jgi:hypothetical protein
MKFSQWAHRIPKLERRVEAVIAMGRILPVSLAIIAEKQQNDGRVECL